MSELPELELFLQKIMEVRSIYLGGASSGIIGSTNSDEMLVNNLRRSTIAFAQEYKKPKPNHGEIKRTSEEIMGNLKALQLTNTLSVQTADNLINDLEKLAEKASV